jgi:hypothetical protein
MQKKTLLSVAESQLNKDVTPKDTVPDEVACASVVSTLLKEVYPETPHITGTYTLWEYLKKNFTELKEPEAGCIVICPTGLGNKGAIGHVWIDMGDGTYASNNSFGRNKGLFTKNYTFDTIRKNYVEKNGFKIFFFKKD